MRDNHSPRLFIYYVQGNFSFELSFALAGMPFAISNGDLNIHRSVQSFAYNAFMRTKHLDLEQKKKSFVVLFFLFFINEKIFSEIMSAGERQKLREKSEWVCVLVVWRMTLRWHLISTYHLLYSPWHCQRTLTSHHQHATQIEQKRAVTSTAWTRRKKNKKNNNM